MRDVIAPPNLAAGRNQLSGRMSREQAAAHARLASLPRRVHLQVRKTEEEIALERGRRSASVKRLRGSNHKGPQIWLDGSNTTRSKR